MRVLMFSWEYPPHVLGGLGNHVAALAPALARQGAEVWLVTPRWAGGEPEEVVPACADREGVHVLRVEPPVGHMGNFFADAQQTNLNLEEAVTRRLLPAGEPDGFDVIHAHDWLVAWAATSLKRLCRVPLVVTIHATERGRGRGHLRGEMQQAINGTEDWLCHEAWRIIACSDYMAHEVRAYFDVPADRVDVIPNGVNTAPFDVLDGVDLWDFRARFAAPDEKIVFHVGRIVHEKGSHLIVEAAPDVLASFPQARFVIAGQGPMLEHLRQRAEALGIASRFCFNGYVSDEDRNRLYRVADCAVFPSLYEPFGIVALEAMAARCPVVVASTGGLAEVVEHNVTGIMVYPDKVDSLAWGILDTLQQPEWSAARAEQAYRKVREEHDWDHIARQTLGVYQRVVSGNAPACDSPLQGCPSDR